MAEIIQLRRDTASNWTTVNPILAQGELGVEIDTTKFKVGDGTTRWNSLTYLINTGNYALLAGAAFTGSISVVGTGYSPNITLTDGSTVSWDTSLGQVATVTLAGNRSVAAPTNLKSGAFYSLAVYQDSTGNRTLSWNSVFKFASGVAPVLSTSASSKDFFVFRSDGTYLYEQGRALGDA